MILTLRSIDISVLLGPHIDISVLLGPPGLN